MSSACGQVWSHELPKPSWPCSPHPQVMTVPCSVNNNSWRCIRSRDSRSIRSVIRWIWWRCSMCYSPVTRAECSAPAAMHMAFSPSRPGTFLRLGMADESENTVMQNYQELRINSKPLNIFIHLSVCHENSVFNWNSKMNKGFSLSEEGLDACCDFGALASIPWWSPPRIYVSPSVT